MVGPCAYLKHQTTEQSAVRECSIPATVTPCHGGDRLHQNSLNLGILALPPWPVTEHRQGLVVNPPGCRKGTLAECAEVLPGFVFLSWFLFSVWLGGKVLGLCPAPCRDVIFLVFF